MAEVGYGAPAMEVEPDLSGDESGSGDEFSSGPRVRPAGVAPGVTPRALPGVTPRFLDQPLPSSVTPGGPETKTPMETDFSAPGPPPQPVRGVTPGGPPGTTPMAQDPVAAAGPTPSSQEVLTAPERRKNKRRAAEDEKEQLQATSEDSAAAKAVRAHEFKGFKEKSDAPKKKRRKAPGGGGDEEKAGGTPTPGPGPTPMETPRVTPGGRSEEFTQVNQISRAVYRALEGSPEEKAAFEVFMTRVLAMQKELQHTDELKKEVKETESANAKIKAALSAGLDEQVAAVVEVNEEGLSKARKQIKKLKRQRRELENDLAESENQEELLKSLLDDANEEIAKLHGTISDMRASPSDSEELKAVVAERDQTKSELLLQYTKAKELTNEIQHLTQRVAELEQEVQNHEEGDALQEDAKAQAEASAEMGRKLTELVKHNRDLQDTVRELEAEVQHVRGEESYHEGLARSSRPALITLSEQKAALEASNRAQKRTLAENQQKIGELEQEVIVRSEESDRLQKQVTELRTKVAQLEGVGVAAKRLQKTKQVQDKALEAARQKYSEAQRQIQQLGKKLQDQESQFALTKLRAEQLEKSQVDDEGEVKELRRQLNSANELTARWKQHADDLQQKLSVQGAQLSTGEQAVGKVSELEGQIAQLKANVEQQTKNFKLLHKSYGAVVQRLSIQPDLAPAEVIKRIDQAEANISATRASQNEQIQKLSTELQSARTLFQSKQAELQNATRAVAQLQSQVAQKDAELQRVTTNGQTQLNQLSEKARNAEALHKQSETEKNAALARIVTLNTTITQLKRDVQEAEAKYNTLAAQHAAFRKSANELVQRASSDTAAEITLKQQLQETLNQTLTQKVGIALSAEKTQRDLDAAVKRAESEKSRADLAAAETKSLRESLQTKTREAESEAKKLDQLKASLAPLADTVNKVVDQCVNLRKHLVVDYRDASTPVVGLAQGLRKTLNTKPDIGARPLGHLISTTVDGALTQFGDSAPAKPKARALNQDLNTHIDSTVALHETASHLIANFGNPSLTVLNAIPKELAKVPLQAPNAATEADSCHAIVLGTLQSAGRLIKSEGNVLDAESKHATSKEEDLKSAEEELEETEESLLLLKNENTRLMQERDRATQDMQNTIEELADWKTLYMYARTQMHVVGMCAGVGTVETKGDEETQTANDALDWKAPLVTLDPGAQGRAEQVVYGPGNNVLKPMRRLFNGYKTPAALEARIKEVQNSAAMITHQARVSYAGNQPLIAQFEGAEKKIAKAIEFVRTNALEGTDSTQAGPVVFEPPETVDASTKAPGTKGETLVPGSEGKVRPALEYMETLLLTMENMASAAATVKDEHEKEYSKALVVYDDRKAKVQEQTQVVPYEPQEEEATKERAVVQVENRPVVKVEKTQQALQLTQEQKQKQKPLLLEATPRVWYPITPKKVDAMFSKAYDAVLEEVGEKTAGQVLKEVQATDLCSRITDGLLGAEQAVNSAISRLQLESRVFRERPQKVVPALALCQATRALHGLAEAHRWEGYDRMAVRTLSENYMELASTISRFGFAPPVSDPVVGAAAPAPGIQSQAPAPALELKQPQLPAPPAQALIAGPQTVLLLEGPGKVLPALTHEEVASEERALVLYTGGTRGSFVGGRAGLTGKEGEEAEREDQLLLTHVMSTALVPYNPKQVVEFQPSQQTAVVLAGDLAVTKAASGGAAVRPDVLQDQSELTVTLQEYKRTVLTMRTLFATWQNLRVVGEDDILPHELAPALRLYSDAGAGYANLMGLRATEIVEAHIQSADAAKLARTKLKWWRRLAARALLGACTASVNKLRSAPNNVALRHRLLAKNTVAAMITDVMQTISQGTPAQQSLKLRVATEWYNKMAANDVTNVPPALVGQLLQRSLHDLWEPDQQIIQSVTPPLIDDEDMTDAKDNTNGRGYISVEFQNGANQAANMYFALPSAVSKSMFDSYSKYPVFVFPAMRPLFDLINKKLSYPVLVRTRLALQHIENTQRQTLNVNIVRLDSTVSLESTVLPTELVDQATGSVRAASASTLDGYNAAVVSSSHALIRYYKCRVWTISDTPKPDESQLLDQPIRFPFESVYMLVVPGSTTAAVVEAAKKFAEYAFKRAKLQQPPRLLIRALVPAFGDNAAYAQAQQDIARDYVTPAASGGTAAEYAFVFIPMDQASFKSAAVLDQGFFTRMLNFAPNPLSAIGMSVKNVDVALRSIIKRLDEVYASAQANGGDPYTIDTAEIDIPFKRPLLTQ